MLITLYGVNNIGKSTQAVLLIERLKSKGYDGVYVKYPIYDIEPSGPFINNLLRNEKSQNISEEELQMWFTLNRYQFQDKLKEYLENGKIVIAEDYIGTGIAWGCVKGASKTWLENLNKNLIKEDLSILIDGERFIHALEKGHVHESNSDLMEKSRIIHLELAKDYGWHIVPLQNGIKKMNDSLWNLIEKYLP